ncbi:MAG: Tetratricopeptide repeat protein [Methanomassiliicoccales archaeon PtaU1.Bin124]|nr:MAG: Tetratricopeptide repeat protein [Methanomassiliicoccales archaeon PtaU1.Bin124]
MDLKKVVLRPIAMWMIVAGLLSIITVFSLTFNLKVLSTVIGYLLLLLVVFLAVYELGVVRSLWIVQEGEYESIIRGIGLNIPFRLLYIGLLFTAYAPNMAAGTRGTVDLLLVLNVITLFVEVLAFAFVYVKKAYFSPPQEEVEAMMKRVQTSAKLVSKCPHCQDVVETEWTCCPGCGSELPHFCAGCGAPVKHGDMKCAACGRELAKAVAVEGLIRTLKDLSEQPATPETRSVRYARYAEALLKGGHLDEAIESYRKAIQFTQFPRKRTNFMVKMANVYQNSGRTKEAEEMLDAALALDPSDWAEAAKKKELLRRGPTCEVKA